MECSKDAVLLSSFEMYMRFMVKELYVIHYLYVRVYPKFGSIDTCLQRKMYEPNNFLIDRVLFMVTVLRRQTTRNAMKN